MSLYVLIMCQLYGFLLSPALFKTGPPRQQYDPLRLEFQTFVSHHLGVNPGPPEEQWAFLAAKHPLQALDI